MFDLFRYLPISALYWDPSLNFPITIPDIFGLGGGDDVVLNGPLFPELHNAQGKEWNFTPTAERKFGEWPDANAAMSLIKAWSPSPQNGYFW